MIRKIQKRMKLNKLQKIEYQNLLGLFKMYNISYDKIGFCHQPGYREELLDMKRYAFFVNVKPYSRDYTKKSRRIIQQVCSTLFEELKKDPDNLGLCVPVSAMLGSILEKEGIWNYQVSGRVRVQFPSDLNIKPIFSNDDPFDDGHAWVVAPPFGVIDLTIKHQHYSNGEQEYMPDTIMYEPSNLYSYYEEHNFIHSPDYHVVGDKNAEITYIIDTIRSSNIENISPSYDRVYPLNGKGLFEIYNSLIKPKLLR